jgi:hypothetical protein
MKTIRKNMFLGWLTNCTLLVSIWRQVMVVIIAAFLCSNALPDLAHPDHPAIAIRVSSDAKIAEAEDGAFLDVTVQNHLPCVSTSDIIFTMSLVVSQELPVDQVTVVLAGRDKERLNFSASAERLAQGLTPLRLFCAVSVLMYSPTHSLSCSHQSFIDIITWNISSR